MARLQFFYRVLEAAVGRKLAYRFGRWLYLGARRELELNGRKNGEFALQEWLLNTWDKIGESQIVLIDVGANIGEWTNSAILLFHERAIESWQIHAIEPVPTLVEKLTSRFSKEIESTSVLVHNIAFSSSDGESTFFISGELAATSSLVKNFEGFYLQEINVKTVKVDSFISKNLVEPVGILKIDTEGNDYQVLKGAIGSLKSHKFYVVQFEYNWRWLFRNNSLKDVFQLNEGLDYQIGKLTPKLIEIHEEWHPELDRYFECNFVLVSKKVLTFLPHIFIRFNKNNVPTPFTG